MSEATLVRDLTDRFGLAPDEARQLAPALKAAIACGLADEASREARRAQLVEANGSLAIEGLALEPDEIRFVEMLDGLALPRHEADALLHRYSLARARSLSAAAHRAA